MSLQTWKDRRWLSSMLIYMLSNYHNDIAKQRCINQSVAEGMGSLNVGKTKAWFALAACSPTSSRELQMSKSFSY